jgi:hypothetical protein
MSKKSTNKTNSTNVSVTRSKTKPAFFIQDEAIVHSMYAIIK